MASIKRHKVLLNQSEAGNGDWIRLDSRYENDASRAIQVELTTGDTVTIEGTTKDVRGGDPATVVAGLTAEDITTLKTYTETTADTLYGPWTYIRATKTGTTGNAKVNGFV